MGHVLGRANDPVGRTQVNIVVTESRDFSSRAVHMLNRCGTIQLKDLDRKQLLAEVPNADVLWVRLRHTIDREVMDAAPQLRLIVTPTTGLNHIDLRAAAEKKIRVLSLRGETDFLKEVRATAELTLGLMLGLLRRIPDAQKHVLEGGWNRDLFKGHELHQKTVGIIGFGRLGSIVARYLEPFGVNILATDPYVDERELPSHIRLVSLRENLMQSDIVSLHVNLTEENKAFLGKSQFQRMRKGSYFINTSRGELIDEAALLEGLVSGQLAGAALDVLSNETSDGMDEHPLVAYAKTHNNLLITPHIGGCTNESMEKTEVYLANRFMDVWPTLEKRVVT